MVDQLGEHGHRFGLIGERRHAHVVKAGRYVLLGSRNNRGLAGPCRKVARRLRKRRHVVAGAGHRQGNQQQIEGRIVRQNAENASKQLTVTEERRRDVDRVGRRREGRELRRMASQNGWRTIIVVTFRPHISRARFILDQCFDGDLVMVASPAQLSVPKWAFQYAYQTAGYVRAVSQPGC